MTNRIHALTVIIDPMRDDDCEDLINAIKMFRFVKGVEPHVIDYNTYWAAETARQDLVDKMSDILFPSLKKKDQQDG